MKKLGVFVLLFFVAISFAVAQENESEDLPEPPPTDDIDLAYQCLEDRVDERSESELSLQEAIFSTLALGADDKLESVIEDAQDGDCFGENGCTLKETAQVLLAYERINKNTDDIEEWLIEQNETATELTWYLQIDITNHVEAQCTLIYEDTEKTITVNEDMTLSGSPGSCLSISSSGFWLRVNDNCIDETFRVSCDQDFVTSLLYQRDGSSTVFVAPTAHSAAALGTTEETINAKCFANSGNCDYEGSLWAAVALDQAGYDVSAFLPYLLALASENQKLFPSAFLYILTQGNDQYSEIIQSQKQNQYWQAPATMYNRFYDTSLAMLALIGSGAQELGNAQNYLLSIQTPEGCWNNNNIRDTAFILYAGWPTSVPGSSGGGGGGAPASCIATGHECSPSLFACSDAGGIVLDLDCDFGVCCSASLQPPSCIEQGGLVCGASQTCSGTVVDSLDGSCCLGACQEIVETTECELGGGSCFSSCTTNEEQTTHSCGIDGSLVCCVPSAETDNEGSGSIWIWIILLLILIVLLILAIVFRRKLQVWWFKFRNRKKKGDNKGGPGPRPVTRKPPFPGYGRRMPPGQMRRPVGQRMQQSRPVVQQRAPPRKAPSKTDKELDETLKKLREMSK